MWMCVGVGVHGSGLKGYVFCCDNLYYGFSCLTFFKSSISLSLTV